MLQISQGKQTEPDDETVMLAIYDVFRRAPALFHDIVSFRDIRPRTYYIFTRVSCTPLPSLLQWSLKEGKWVWFYASNKVKIYGG